MQQIHVLIRGFDKAAGIIRMRVGVAAHGVDAEIDAAVYQPAGDNIPDRIALSQSAVVKRFVDIAVTLNDYRAFNKFPCLHLCSFRRLRRNFESRRRSRIAIFLCGSFLAQQPIHIEARGKFYHNAHRYCQRGESHGAGAPLLLTSKAVPAYRHVWGN
jgi:hypothetical protein